MRKIFSKIIIGCLLITMQLIVSNHLVFADYKDLVPEMFKAGALDLETLTNFKQIQSKGGGSGGKDENTSAGADKALSAPQYLATGVKKSDPGVYVARVIANILLIAGILAVIMIIISGIRYIMAYGKDENIEAAKKTLTWAILGLLAIILAYFIVENITIYFYKELMPKK